MEIQDFAAAAIITATGIIFGAMLVWRHVNRAISNAVTGWSTT